MKFLITGDWHLSERTPENRIDDYFKSMIEKMTYIFSMAEEHKVEAILQPGDMFDSYKISDGIKRRFIQFFREYDIPIITVPGQHDLRYHSANYNNTPMGVLEAAGVIKIANKYGGVFQEDNCVIRIYGAGWGEKIPIIKPPSDIDILITHRMVALKSQWPGHEYYNADKLLRENDFNLIVTGDNHKSFTSTTETKLKCTDDLNKSYIIRGKTLINCGSLMRSNIDQSGHMPVIYIFDTDDMSYKFYLIPVQPFDEVMNIGKVKEQKEKNEELNAFIDGLSDANIEGLDFKKNLIDYLKDNKDTIGEGVIKIIDKILGD